VGKLIKDVRIIREGPGATEAALATVDRDGRIANLGDCAGEIVVSQESLGSSAFTGYYKLPDESSKRMVAVDGREFYRMGDLGAIVSEGGEKHLVFLGRTGDWMRFKGENWSPVDAERVVIRFAGVRNVGIIGVPQRIGKEDDPMFVVEPVDIETFDVGGFLEYCRKSLPHYMQPRFLRLSGSLPMTETMKLVKTSLRRDFICRTPETDADPSDVLYELRGEEAVPFKTSDYKDEMKKCTDPTNRDRLVAFTKRQDIFED
jgi:acyl-CoA synthetase (AMP-forming)/AMP-acid ligase II